MLELNVYDDARGEPHVQHEQYRPYDLELIACEVFLYDLHRIMDNLLQCVSPFHSFIYSFRLLSQSDLTVLSVITVLTVYIFIHSI